MGNCIINKLIDAVSKGAAWNIDFKKRNLKVNGAQWIENGVCDMPTGVEYSSSEQFINRVESLYDIYKHSIPSERSESKGKRYFRALPEQKLSDESMMYGILRDVAQAELEGFVLCGILEGVKWDESWGKWFWQSPKDGDLVLLREWFEP